MKRVFVAFAFALFVTVASGVARADEPGAEASGTVFVSRPGKIPLRQQPALGAPAKTMVGYGQKLALKRKTASEPAWLLVQVPGDAAQGWIPAQATIDKRPAIDAHPLADAAEKIKASENSTATAIRGLDGRTAAYAKDKQLPPEAFDQLSRVEAFGEQLFSDRHSTDAKGGWHYPDATVQGRLTSATQFATPEGLVVPKPAPAATPSGPAPASSAQSSASTTSSSATTSSTTTPSSPAK